MNFSWTAEQQQLRQAITDFAQTELNSDISEHDKEQTFNFAGWAKCGQFGIQGLPIPAEYGGRGIDPLTTMYALEGLGYGCRDNGLNFSLGAHLLGNMLPILAFGSESQKQNYLPKLCSGEWIGALALSEPEAGSDAYSLKTTARKHGEGYRLNGEKIYITNGPIADVFVVLATVDRSIGGFGLTAFLVERDTPGLSLSPLVDKMGLRTVPMGTMAFENCEVPASNLIGQQGSGLALFNHAMEWERGFILACAVGAMQRQLETCVQYAQQRHQFGQAISKFQMVSSKIVEMRMRLETSRMLLYKVGWLKQEGKSTIMESAMAKLHISEAWIQSCQDAIQIHGGCGYLTEFELERELRDALGSRIYSGTSEIQRLVIGEFMGL